MSEITDMRGVHEMLLPIPGVTANPDQLGRVSTTDALVRKLVSEILSGEFQPGASLRETELATRFGVSRQSVREALGVLVERGMLRREAHRGVRMFQLTRADVADIYDIRRFVESEAIRRVVERPESWPALEQAARRFERLSDDDAWGTVVQVDVGFHLTLVHGAGSPRLLRLYEPIAIDFSLAHVPVRQFISASELLGAHRELYDAIAAADAPEALRRLEEHINWGYHEVIDSLTDNPTS